MTHSNIITPVNFATGKSYQGDKAKLLQEAASAKGYKSHEWATMNQWNSCKRSIARGEKGTPITYPRILESEDGPVDVVETSYLFNRDQLARTVTSNA